VNERPFSEGGGVTQRKPPHREVHLRDLTVVVVRHWVLVLLLVVLVGAGAYYSGSRAITQYQSVLTVQITSPKQVFARLDDIDVDELALRTDPILSEALVLTTRGLALKVVDDLGLQLHPADPNLSRGGLISAVTVDPDSAGPGAYHLTIEPQGYRLRNMTGAPLASGPLDQTVEGPGFTFRVIPQLEPTSVELRISSRPAAAATVTAGLSYHVRDGTNAVDLSYTGTDPSIVPRVLNNAAIALRKMGVDRALEAAVARRDYIEAQLERSDSLVQASRRNLQQFRESRQITDLSAQATAIVQTIQRLEQERQLELVRLSTIQDAMSAPDSIGVETLSRLAAIEGIGSNAALSFQIRTLLQLYEDRRSLTAGALGLREGNPQVSSLNEQIRLSHKALQGAVDATVLSIQSRVDALDREIAEQRAELSEFPGLETRIGQLTLESNILDETQRYLLGQYQQARMQEATIAPYIQILDSASPAFRIGTSLRQRVVLGVLVGLLLGLAAAFFLEYLDQTVKSSADIERVLGVPVLGAIPHDPKLNPRLNSRHKGVVTISHLDPDEPSVESYRALRTNVTFVGAEKPLQFIAVTSPGPREGKSTTAINLALTLAQSGRRTILIDGDLRRSTVHHAFNVVQEPGLTDVLVGDVSASEGIRPGVAPSLDVLPSGSTPPNPSELLGSSAMDALLAELRHDYEYVIMDTPPALPVTDAAVVATNADATILVVKSGDTEETAAQRALDQLRRVGGRIAGAVLNSVSHRKDPHYAYYGYSYRSDPPQRSRIRGAASKVAGLI
jgi:capsular exopolysaccharide synthesis family protein